jgi:hypothetical protein
MTDKERRLWLAARRELLVQRAAAQRVQLGHAAAPLALSWQRVERALLLWRSVRQRPWLVAAPVAVLVLWRPRWAGRLITMLPTLWHASRLAPWSLRR